MVAAIAEGTSVDTAEDIVVGTLVAIADTVDTGAMVTMVITGDIGVMVATGVTDITDTTGDMATTVVLGVGIVRSTPTTVGTGTGVKPELRLLRGAMITPLQACLRKQKRDRANRNREPPVAFLFAL